MMNRLSFRQGATTAGRARAVCALFIARTLAIPVLVAGVLFGPAPAVSAAGTREQVVEATVRSLAAAGLLPVPAKELEMLTPFINCLADGRQALECSGEAVFTRVLGPQFKEAAPLLGCIAQGEALAACVQKAAVAQLPAEARPVVDCMLRKPSVIECAQERALAALPEDVRPVAQCLLQNGSPEKCALTVVPPEVEAVLKCAASVDAATRCAEDEILAQMPPSARQVFECAQGGSDAIACAKRMTQGADRRAIEAIEKAAGPYATGIIAIVRAIQNDDWASLSVAIGGEAAKVVACATFEVFLGPGPHQQVLCETAGNIVDTAQTRLREFVQQARNGDIGGMLGTVAKLLGKDRQCAFARVIAPDIEPTICGVLDEVIEMVAESSIAHGVIAGMLTGNAVTGALVYAGSELFGEDLGKGLASVVDLITSPFADDEKDCGSVTQFYADQYLACYHRAAYVGMTNPAGLAGLGKQKYDKCMAQFGVCDRGQAAKICAGLAQRFNFDVQALVSTFETLADTKARAQKAYFEGKRSLICSITEPDRINADARNGFVMECESMLQSLRPMRNEADANCSAPGERSFGLALPTAYAAACQRAAQGDLTRVIGEVCAGAGLCFALKKCPADFYLDLQSGECRPVSHDPK